MAPIVTDSAFMMLEEGIVLLNTLISSSPFNRALKDRKRIANVEVFIPPPVDAGEAPINIRTIMKVRVILDRDPMAMVLNPAVRVVTD